MSLDKAIEHGKEKRKNYHRSIDSWCNNHGGCPWCESDRLHSIKKRKDAAKDKMREFKNEH